MEIMKEEKLGYHRSLTIMTSSKVILIISQS